MNSSSPSADERTGTPAHVNNSVFDKPINSVFARSASSARSARRAIEQPVTMNRVISATTMVFIQFIEETSAQYGYLSNAQIPKGDLQWGAGLWH